MVLPALARHLPAGFRFASFFLFNSAITLCSLNTFPCALALGLLLWPCRAGTGQTSATPAPQPEQGAGSLTGKTIPVANTRERERRCTIIAKEMVTPAAAQPAAGDSALLAFS
jgi:hypothetical protein